MLSRFIYRLLTTLPRLRELRSVEGMKHGNAVRQVHPRELFKCFRVTLRVANAIKVEFSRLQQFPVGQQRLLGSVAPRFPPPNSTLARLQGKLKPTLYLPQSLSIGFSKISAFPPTCRPTATSSIPQPRGFYKEDLTLFQTFLVSPEQSDPVSA